MFKKRIYYKVEVRIKMLVAEREYEIDEDEFEFEDEEYDEEKYIVYEENISWSDGAIIIENGKFKGFLTKDYIWGEINEEKIVLHILDNNTEYLLFETTEENNFIELPNVYKMDCIVEELNFYTCEINFKGIEKNPTEISNIENQLERVKEYYNI